MCLCLYFHLSKQNVFGTKCPQTSRTHSYYIKYFDVLFDSYFSLFLFPASYSIYLFPKTSTLLPDQDSYFKAPSALTNFGLYTRLKLKVGSNIIYDFSLQGGMVLVLPSKRESNER